MRRCKPPIIRMTVLGATAVLGFLPAAPALACSCGSGQLFSLPAANAVGVARNPLIRLGYVNTGEAEAKTESDRAGATGLSVGASGYVLQGEDGGQITLRSSVQTQKSISVVSLRLPEGLLLAEGTRYAVLGDGQGVLSFTTGSAVDTAPPSLAGITRVTGGYNDGITGTVQDSCGESVALYVTYEGASDALTPASSLLYHLVVRRPTVAGSAPVELYVPGDYFVGSSTCLTTVSGLTVGEKVELQASVVDGAGLESPVSATVTATVAADPDASQGASPSAGGCQLGTERRMGQGGVGWLGMGLLGGWLGWRRRRADGSITTRGCTTRDTGPLRPSQR